MTPRIAECSCGVMSLIFEVFKCIDALNGGASCLDALSQLTVHVLSAFVAL